ncbi:hypothetical protein LTR70_000988 [Exophiala xenobiotica]|uniref:Uncharacterized protein n=1 Tax=Lithohypha guttulata TaxID=1690604 RepID=A0ABR0K0L2_9EURO|nr:hypothetical protein LTR24_008253 [Lithohypha guttulata]KAK5329151.1 hypothetical protein LTR70_000988 [Exophiala xenobiotica]
MASPHGSRGTSSPHGSQGITSPQSSRGITSPNPPLGMTSQPLETGYPCTAVNNWIPNAHQVFMNCIEIKRGDLGKVLSEKNIGWQKVWLVRNGVQGSVPSWTIQVHRTRKYGDLRIQHDIPTISSSGVDYSRLEVTPRNRLEKVIVGLVTAMRNKQASLPFMSEGIRDILNNDARRQRFLLDFIKNLNPKYVDIANNDQKTVADFRSTLKVVVLGSSTAKTGILHRNDQRQLLVPIPASQALRCRLRWTIAADISGRDANIMEMYALCQMSKDDVFGMLLGEQILMLTNGSYVPNMYVADVGRAATAPTDPEDTSREVVKVITLREVAHVLISVANTVFNDIGWTPLCSRPTFGVGKGLNYSSPLVEASRYEKTLWIKVVQPGVKEVFYREGSEMKPPSGGRSAYQTSFMKMSRYAEEGGVTWMNMYFHKDKNHPPQGTVVYPIWEIQLNGPHPIPWARLNDVGLPSDWHVANTLALRLEWQDKDGQWWRTYQQSDLQLKFEPTNDQGALINYNQAMAVIRFLQQRQQFSPRSWFYNAGIARIKQLTFDHASQTVRLQELAPPPEPWKKVTPKSNVQIRQEMAAAGCVNVGGTWNVRGRRGQPGQGRKERASKCDACYIITHFDGTARRTSKRSGVDCTRRLDANGQATNQCDTCWHRGLPCSWTYMDDINVSMLRALNWKAKVE